MLMLISQLFHAFFIIFIKFHLKHWLDNFFTTHFPVCGLNCLCLWILMWGGSRRHHFAVKQPIFWCLLIGQIFCFKKSTVLVGSGGNFWGFFSVVTTDQVCFGVVVRIIHFCANSVYFRLYLSSIMHEYLALVFSRVFSCSFFVL